MVDTLLDKSKLQRGLDEFAQSNWQNEAALLEIASEEISSANDARAVCQHIEHLLQCPSPLEEYRSPLHSLIAFFQQAVSEEAVNTFRQDGLPLLRKLVQRTLDGDYKNKHDVMLALKILAVYQQAEDVSVITHAARQGFESDGFLWSIILSIYSEEPDELSLQMIEALRDPLPQDFIRVAYLDAANQVAINGALQHHPFDNDTGAEHLRHWLSSADPEQFSYAHSATAALPFISETYRNGLLALALKHPDESIRLEAAWAQAKLGDENGVTTLIFYTMNTSYSRIAQQYLEELGFEDRIPARAKDPDFQALAELSNWLAHPNEYGRAPDKMEIVDQRQLYWPPSGDERPLWLIKYTYNTDNELDRDEGIGMVGSVTFALFGENTPDKSAEELYALHCAWEMERRDDISMREDRSMEYGMSLLREYNDDF